MVDANNNGKFKAKQVKKGDLIRSADWNTAIKEIERLGNTTSNLNQNDFKGPLTIEGALNVKGNVDIGTKDKKVEVKIEGNLTVNGAISGNIDAGNITSGELDVQRIPNLSADKITSGKLAVQRIPNLSANKITSGELAVERIPNLSADKITTGTIEGDLTVRNILAIGDTPFEGNFGGNREWMTKGMKIFWDTDNLFIGLKDEGNNRKDAVIAWGDDRNDNLRFIHTSSGGEVDGNEVMQLSPSGNLSLTGQLKIGDLYAMTGKVMLRIIRGKVIKDGTIATGEGFTSKKFKDGIYDITFNQAFSDTPAVIATQIYPSDTSKEGGDTRDNAVVVGIESTKCRIKCGSSSGTAADRHFSFLCIGT